MTKIFSNLIYIVASVFFLTSCSTNKIQNESNGKVIPNNSHSTLIVYWHQNNISLFENFFGLRVLDISVDGKKIGSVSTNSYAALGLKAGSRNISFAVTNSSNEKMQPIKLDLVAGKEIVMEVITDRVPSTKTYYDGGVYYADCNCIRGAGYRPAFFYDTYDLHELAEGSKFDGEQRSFFYVEP